MWQLVCSWEILLNGNLGKALIKLIPLKYTHIKTQKSIYTPLYTRVTYTIYKLLRAVGMAKKKKSKLQPLGCQRRQDNGERTIWFLRSTRSFNILKSNKFFVSHYVWRHMVGYLIHASAVLKFKSLTLYMCMRERERNRDRKTKIEQEKVRLSLALSVFSKENKNNYLTATYWHFMGRVLIVC